MTLVAACGKASFSVCFVSGTAFGLICSSRSYGPAKSLSPMMDRTLALSKSAGSTQENVPRYGSQSPSIPHAGVAAARNDAMARASGEFVAFLDSDDRWMPEKLERVVALISSGPQADLIYHDVMMITPSGQSWKEISGPPPPDPCRRLSR